MNVVILAAGRGTRMRSATPKLLHDFCGRPLIDWPVAAALSAGAERVIVVVAEEGPLVDALPEGVLVARQAQPDGTGGAVLAAAEQIDRDATVIVLAGDVPLVEPSLLRELAAAHQRSDAAATMVTMVLANPEGYGRVVRDADGAVERVVETKEPSGASAAELAINEVNTGVFAFSAAPLLEALGGVAPVGGELYLPGVLPLLRAGGGVLATLPADDPALLAGVNDRAQLAAARTEAERRIQERHMLAGVTIVQPQSTSIGRSSCASSANAPISASRFLCGRLADRLNRTRRSPSPRRSPSWARSMRCSPTVMARRARTGRWCAPLSATTATTPLQNYCYSTRSGSCNPG